MAATINALLTTFPGLPNYNLPLPSTTSISALHSALHSLLPPTTSRLLLTTVSGTTLHAHSTLPLSTLTNGASFLPLRLSIPLLGGKGGFGSQLRAAGGRMSSRKKRGQQENNDSCRNLDGRRMRTVKEAKALAAYLEIKPDMERKEREKRRERALKIIEAAERKEDGKGKRFEDVKWLEETEEERERTRIAVERAMRKGFTDRTFKGEGSSGSGSDEDDEEESDDEASGSGSGSASVAKKAAPRFAGWDEDDEFMSSDSGEDDEDKGMEDIQEEDEEEEEVEEEYEGKGKGKAKA